jgi:hypothetical protein
MLDDSFPEKFALEQAMKAQRRKGIALPFLSPRR